MNAATLLRRSAIRCAALALIAVLAPAAENDHPGVEIGQGDLRMLVHLPDAKRGYYRSTRFDWSGQVGWLRWRGHTLFGPWRTPHDPMHSENAIGPAEEFSPEDPPGFAEAAAGGTFLKIGVGRLVKDATPEYSFAGGYRIAEGGTWTVQRASDAVETVQELAPMDGWGCRWRKRIAVDADGCGFRIEHELRNTGSRRIATTQYCHNFIVIDGEPVGPGYRVLLPQGAQARFASPGMAELRDGALVVLEQLDPGKAVFAELSGAGGADGYSTAVEHRGRGLTLRISGDRAPVAFRFYAMKQAISPEPFIAIDVAPGAASAWTTRYRLEKTPSPSR